MAAKKQVPQTLKEFQAWLEGIEEVQAKGWVPDKQQWNKIRKRIENIKEPDPAPASQPRMMQPPPGPAPMPYQPGPAPMAPAPLMQAPTDIEMSPAAAALLKTGKMPEMVDASSGPIDSSFE